MTAKPFSNLTRNDVFCSVVSNLNAAIGEIDTGNINKARKILADAIRVASLHPSHGAIVDIFELGGEVSWGL